MSGYSGLKLSLDEKLGHQKLHILLVTFYLCIDMTDICIDETKHKNPVSRNE